MAGGGEEGDQLPAEEPAGASDGHAKGPTLSACLFGQVGGEGHLPVAEHPFEPGTNDPVAERTEGAEGELPGDLVGGARARRGEGFEAVEVLPAVEGAAEHPVAEMIRRPDVVVLHRPDGIDPGHHRGADRDAGAVRDAAGSEDLARFEGRGEADEGAGTQVPRPDRVAGGSELDGAGIGGHG